MTAEELVDLLGELRNQREHAKHATRSSKSPRSRLSRADREMVLRKTGGKCHICGGAITGRWHADHVLAHSRGGSNTSDNYLPAHAACNNYRWDYSPEEFHYILKLGVWLRTQIERRSEIGLSAAAPFARHEASRMQRRRSRGRANGEK